MKKWMDVTIFLRTTFLVLATGALMTFTAAPSFGESCVYPEYNQLVVDDGNIVPVNVAGIPWITSLGVIPEITLTNAEGVAVDFIVTGSRRDQLRMIIPADWAQGNTYRIILKVYSPDEAGNNSTNNLMTVEFADLDQIINVGPPLALLMPSTFDVSPVETGTTYSYEFGNRDSAWVNIQANFLDDPPSSFYLYTTFVDGVEYRFSEGCGLSEMWPGRKQYGPGSDRLVVLCNEEDFRLKPGAHEFQLEVRIMGTATKALSSPLPVNIPCAESEPLDTDQDEDVGSSSDQTVESGCSSIESDTSLVLLILGFLMFRRRVAHLELDGK
jgi:hypothetical protein